jgi:protein TonB
MIRPSLLDSPPARSRGGLWLACTVALVAHGAAAAAAMNARGPAEHEIQRAAFLSEMIEIEEPPAPPPPAPPPTVEEPPPPAPKVAMKPAPIAPRAPEPEPPPAAAAAAAQAAQVLAQAPQDEVLDFGETVVQGDSAQFAGGVTESGGTSAKAVRDTRARTGGIEGGTGTATSGIDRSRSASLAGAAVWDCPFPEEADDEGIDEAVVTLRVRVALDGTLEAVDVARDPGTGFGREARRCARDKRWQPARDRAGTPVASQSMINVRFSR